MSWTEPASFFKLRRAAGRLRSSSYAAPRAAGPSAMWFEWGIRFFGKGRVRFFSVGCAVGASGIGMNGAYEGVEKRMFYGVWAASGGRQLHLPISDNYIYP